MRLALLPLLALLLIAPLATAASWGNYTVLEEITIPTSTLNNPSTTWYPLTKAYASPVVGIQPSGIAFDANATDKKFVIKLLGASNGYSLDLAFFESGVIDIVETTPSGATKLADTSASGITWNSIDFIIVKLENTRVTLETSNGTVLATVTWNNAPSMLDTIGASGANALTAGTVYVAILEEPVDPATAMESSMQLITGIMPLMVTLITLGLVLRFFDRIVSSIKVR